MNMDEVLKSDYQRVCEMAYHSRTIEQAEVPLFYIYLMCQQLGFENHGLRVESGRPLSIVKILPPLHEAIWNGVAMALWASPCHIKSFTPSPVYSFSGRLLKVELRGILHDRYSYGGVDFDLANLVEYVENIHNMDEYHTIKPSFI